MRHLFAAYDRLFAGSLRALGHGLGAACLSLVACTGSTADATPADEAGIVGVAPDGSGAGVALPAQGTTYGSSVDPGSKPLQRLNAVEYDNTVRDLTGTQRSYTGDFPADGLYYNFDNIADQLSVNPPIVQSMVASALAVGQEVADSAGDATARSNIYLKVAPCADDSGVKTSSCLAQTIQSFGLRAWRRPLTGAEVSFVSGVAAAAGDTLPVQVGAAVATLLTSPYFNFRVELDPAAAGSNVHALNAYELATRLSYFLWRTCPDDTLLANARSGMLLTDAGLRSEVNRMLADPRATSLVSGFASRWLFLNQLDQITPDPVHFPNFTEAVRTSMRAETQTFLADFVLRGRPLNQLLTANYSYLDATLAAYYGVPAPRGNGMVRCVLPASSNRVGVLSQGAMLVVGSTGAETSPIKRGKTILMQLLCSAPPGPPADIPSLNNTLTGSVTVRQALNNHVASPSCAGCHVNMDALGFAFEGFSGSGEQRTLDHGFPVDTSGTFNSTFNFTSNVDLMPALASDSRFPICATRMLLVYALGRSVTDADEATVTGLSAFLAANQLSLPALMQQIVLSRAFRSRHA